MTLQEAWKMSFVEFHDVSKFYTMGSTQIKAADKVNFTIGQGEFCVIVGPSGAGKTTVLNMLGGMDKVSEGTILVDGAQVSSFNERQLTDYRRYGSAPSTSGSSPTTAATTWGSCSSFIISSRTSRRRKTWRSPPKSAKTRSTRRKR